MAKPRIIWSLKAKEKRVELMQFYIQRNENKNYTKKLNSIINQELRRLIDYPNLGIRTELDQIRGLIIKDLILFYEINEDSIIVHTLWDARQNPEKLILK